jgi:hypothetical protein
MSMTPIEITLDQGQKTVAVHPLDVLEEMDNLEYSFGYSRENDADNWKRLKAQLRAVASKQIQEEKKKSEEDAKS